jgi:hypothetical protein
MSLKTKVKKTIDVDVECEIGDTVYLIHPCEKKKEFCIIESTVIEINIHTEITKEKYTHDVSYTWLTSEGRKYTSKHWTRMVNIYSYSKEEAEEKTRKLNDKKGTWLYESLFGENN